MRAFVAVELPASVRADLRALTECLAQAHGDVKWVEEENLHITMRFLGEIREDQRAAIEALLTRIAGCLAPITLQLAGIGAFPSVSAPRVVWAGVGQGADVLTRIAGEFEAGLRPLGFEPEERKFTAHVTLGRVRSPRNLSRLSSQLKTTAWTPPPAFPAAHLTLFQSTLSIAGSTYTPLLRAAFTAA